MRTNISIAEQCIAWVYAEEAKGMGIGGGGWLVGVGVYGIVKQNYNQKGTFANAIRPDLPFVLNVLWTINAPCVPLYKHLRDSARRYIRCYVKLIV